MSETINALSLAQAEEAIRVAVALGYPAPTFLGATVWCATVVIVDNGNVYFWEGGVYLTKEAGQTAIRNWVVNRCYETGKHPLFEHADDGVAPLSDFVDYSKYNDTAIIDAYFCDTTDFYNVIPYTISPHPPTAT